ncbi:MAG TPA: hypothetical protein VLX44_16020 [Xanthobacteraceae bacterium]|nr:hypothetical protein [Xanthobacteraceae bacterium]
MRRAATVVAGAIAIALALFCAEFVFDIRTPSSGLAKQSALGASASISLSEYNSKLAQYRKQYGEDRVSVGLEGSTGRITVEVDGKLVEESRTARRFAGMYGMFVVRRDGADPAIFPFAINPGEMPTDHEPNIERLRGRFEERLPARLLAFNDNDWTRDSCVAIPGAETGLPPRLARWLGVRSQTHCIVRWNGPTPGSMVVGVTLFEDNAWVRPFAPWICRTMTAAMLDGIISSDPAPDYAACVLVDRPARTGPTGSQEAFTSDVYEVRGRSLARVN